MTLGLVISIKLGVRVQSKVVFHRRLSSIEGSDVYSLMDLLQGEGKKIGLEWHLPLKVVID